MGHLGFYADFTFLPYSKEKTALYKETLAEFQGRFSHFFACTQATWHFNRSVQAVKDYDLLTFRQIVVILSHEPSNFHLKYFYFYFSIIEIF